MQIREKNDLSYMSIYFFHVYRRKKKLTLSESFSVKREYKEGKRRTTMPSGYQNFSSNSFYLLI